MSKSKGISNKEQGILNFEGIKNNEGLSHARQYFDIQNSLFNIHYSLFLILKASNIWGLKSKNLTSPKVWT